MSEYLQKCIENQDSAGGVVSCKVHGMPAGIGEPVFDKLDAELSKAIMSIGSVKASRSEMDLRLPTCGVRE